MEVIGKITSSGNKKSHWKVEEDSVIIQYHKIWKKGRWSEISKNLPGRTDNDIKNHWNSTFRKCCRYFLRHRNQKMQLENKKIKKKKAKEKENGVLFEYQLTLLNENPELTNCVLGNRNNNDSNNDNCLDNDQNTSIKPPATDQYYYPSQTLVSPPTFNSFPSLPSNNVIPNHPLQYGGVNTIQNPITPITPIITHANHQSSMCPPQSPLMSETSTNINKSFVPTPHYIIYKHLNSPNSFSSAMAYKSEYPVGELNSNISSNKNSQPFISNNDSKNVFSHSMSTSQFPYQSQSQSINSSQDHFSSSFLLSIPNSIALNPQDFSTRKQNSIVIVPSPNRPEIPNNQMYTANPLQYSYQQYPNDVLYGLNNHKNVQQVNYPFSSLAHPYSSPANFMTPTTVVYVPIVHNPDFPR